MPRSLFRLRISGPAASCRVGTLAVIPALLVCFLLLAGCAGNVVTLSYPTLPTPERPVAGKARSLCVVDFTNNREQAAIGERLDTTPILPRTPVERWMATGLAAELRREGYTVIMAETLAEGATSGADYLVVGEAEEVWLAQASHTRYTGSIRATITLLDASGNRVTRNTYSSAYSKGVFPGGSIPQDLLDEALAEMLRPAAKLLVKSFQ